MLLDPISLEDLDLTSRVVMAPMTRCAASEDQVPTREMADYYADRASVGLVIAEATCISPCANAYPCTPGIFTDEQVIGWKRVTDSVHAKGGKIFVQLWHAGMMGHSSFRSGDLPLSPSGVRPLRECVPRSKLVYETPRSMEDEDFAYILDLFAQAALRAKAAGFDGVELHAAGGYLLDSFLHHHTNRRKDSYAAPECRFILEVFDAVSSLIRTGIRLSPVPLIGMENMHFDQRDLAVFQTLFRELQQRKVAYVHAATDSDTHDELGRVTQFIRTHYRGTLIGGGGYTPVYAKESLSNGHFDLISFGRLLMANPDLMELIRRGVELKPYLPDMIANPPPLRQTGRPFASRSL